MPCTCLNNLTYTEIDRRLTYSINSVNAYTHKSVE